MLWETPPSQGLFVTGMDLTVPLQNVYVEALTPNRWHLEMGPLRSYKVSMRS